jgi:D-galacturonate reductase
MEGKHVGIVGAGMIVHDQIYPALRWQQLNGRVLSIRVCSTGSVSLKRLRDDPNLNHFFGSVPFDPYPGFDTESGRKDPEMYKRLIKDLPAQSIVVVAVPDALHYPIIMEALEHNLHVVVVKPLCLTLSEAEKIRDKAYDQGLVVAIDFHKRFDPHAQLGYIRWKNGEFGQPRLAWGSMIEAWSPYRDAGEGFERHFHKDNDPFFYVGNHYVDMFGWLTGLRPQSVFVQSVRGTFPNGNEADMYSAAMLDYGTAVLTLHNGLGVPTHSPRRNDQGLVIFGERDGDGTCYESDDDQRGMLHVRGRKFEGKLIDGGSPDYMSYGLSPRIFPGHTGFQPLGYGAGSIEAFLVTIEDVCQSGSLSERQQKLEEIDERDFIPTPANTLYLTLVGEAGRKSLETGLPVAIDCESMTFK